MDIASHLEKVKRFERARGKLNPETEFEMWYWMSLSGGTSAINAALHAAKLTDDGDYFTTQSVDVYMQGGKHDKPESWKPKFMWDVDVIHIHMPDISKPLTPKIKKAYAAMQVLEDVRDPCVRGDRKITKKIVRDVDTAFTAAVALCKEVVEEAGSKKRPARAAKAAAKPARSKKKTARGGNADDPRIPSRQGEEDHPRHASFHDARLRGRHRRMHAGGHALG